MMHPYFFISISSAMKAAKQWWCNRQVRKNLTVADYREINRLLIKAGRRCAYDLAHAAAGQRSSKEGEFFHHRANRWQDIFNPGDDGKSYRDELHHTISDLEWKVEKYRKFLAEKGIEDPFPETPF